MIKHSTIQLSVFFLFSKKKKKRTCSISAINPKLALDILLYIFYISQFAGSKNSDSKGFGGGKFGGGGSTSNW